MAPVLGGHMFYIGLYKENIKTFLSETIRPRALIFGISPSGPLPILFKLCPWGQFWPHLSGHMFYIGLYRGSMEKSSCLKP